MGLEPQKFESRVIKVLYLDFVEIFCDLVKIMSISMFNVLVGGVNYILWSGYVL